MPVSHQPAHIKYVPFTRDQMREQTRQLAETIRAVTLMRCADTGPFKVHIECPACHLFEAIELETRFGRISYFCPACENYWDVGACEPLPTKHRRVRYGSPPVPWKCPACQSEINHSEAEHRPHVGMSYRCHICRLELTVDPILERLVVTPLRDDEAREKKRSIK